MTSLPVVQQLALVLSPANADGSIRPDSLATLERLYRSVGPELQARKVRSSPSSPASSSSSSSSFRQLLPTKSFLPNVREFLAAKQIPLSDGDWDDLRVRLGIAAAAPAVAAVAAVAVAPEAVVVAPEAAVEAVPEAVAPEAEAVAEEEEEEEEAPVVAVPQAIVPMAPEEAVAALPEPVRDRRAEMLVSRLAASRARVKILGQRLKRRDGEIIKKLQRDKRALQHQFVDHQCKKVRKERYLSVRGGLLLACRRTVANSSSQGVGILLGVGISGKAIRTWELRLRASMLQSFRLWMKRRYEWMAQPVGFKGGMRMAVNRIRSDATNYGPSPPLLLLHSCWRPIFILLTAKVGK